MPNNQVKISPEHAVRQYMRFLDDPKSLVDEDNVQKANQKVVDAIDPIDKLVALGELERVSKVDENPLRAGFVAHAKAWAEKAQVPVSSFQQLKVPADVLREAGFDVAVDSRSTRPPGRAKSVPIEQIVPEVLKLKGPFIQTDIIGKIGGSPATVRKAVDQLIAEGQVKNLGASPDHAGRGRAPIQYEVVPTT